jgi:hypothetical protein
MKKPKVEDLKFGEQTELDRREREVQLILNVIEPDPHYQPLFISDQSLVCECSRNEEALVAERLRTHFGNNIEFDLNATIVEMVDSIKRQIRGWPDHRK